jgi:signal transduction histidine kinase
MMFRVTGPEQQRSQVYRYQISTFLALGGIMLALTLTWNLSRTLRKNRADRERLRDELRRSEHLASLGMLLAQVAHEVRNPLAGIRSTAQLWERLPDEARTPESLKAVIEAVDRLDGLVSQLLYFSRSENADRQRVDLNSVVGETFDLLRAQASQQNVRVESDLDPRLPAIRGSAPALRQVVLNLAMNALQAMPQSGRLSCRTRLDDSHRAVELEIGDTGPGIDPTTRARLFEPFFTTRPKGTGLGLALCREIVLQHDGRIELVPGQPHGTVCRVIFPIRD